MTDRPLHDDTGDLLAPEVQRSFADAIARRAADSDAHPTHRRSALLAVSALGTVLAAALVLVVALAASPSGGPVDVLARAQAALTTRGELVHYTVRVRHGSGNEAVTGTGPDLTVKPGRCNRPSTHEVWQATDTNRWRAITQACVSGDHRRRYRTPDSHESSWVPGVSTTYSARERRLDVLTGLARNSSAGTVPLGLSTIGPGDPIAFIRDLLAAGELEQHGTRRRNGRQVLTLTGQRTGSHQGITGVTRVVYDVDPDTYQPVRITTVRTLRPTDPNRCKNRCRGLLRPHGERMDFTTYERHPLDAATERLLTITPPSGTRVRERTLAEARRSTARRIRAQDRRDEQRQRHLGRP